MGESEVECLTEFVLGGSLFELQDERHSMYETDDGYIFETFRDGRVIFFRDSYKRHSGYHGVIVGEEGRNEIQNALIYPHYITSFQEKNSAGKTISHNKKYRFIIREIKTSRRLEREYWEIILKKPLGKRMKIATAFVTSAPEYAIINDRVETLEYKREFKRKNAK